MTLRFIPLLFLAAGFGSRCQPAQELPAEVQQAIEAAADRTQVTEEEIVHAATARLSELLAKLKKHQVQFTMNAQLDEAVAVRDLLRELGDEADPESAAVVLEAHLESLPQTASETARKYQADSETASKALKEKRTQLAAARKKVLQPLFEKYTQAGDLDTALAIREAMQDESASPTDHPAPKRTATRADLVVEALPREVAAARRSHVEQGAKLNAWLQAELLREARTLATDLQKVQERETKAGHLDKALKLRDLLTQLNVESSGTGRLNFIRNARPGLSESAVEKTDSTIAAADAIDKQFNEARDELDRSLAKILKDDVAKVLTTGMQDLDKCLPAIDEYYQLLRDHESRAALRSIDKLPVEFPELSDAVSDFEGIKARALEKIVEQEQKRREELVTELTDIRESEELTDESRGAISSLIEFVAADYSQGPLGLSLYPRLKHLPESALDAIRQARSDVRAAATEATSGLEKDWAMVSNQLEPSVKMRIAEGQFASAFQALRILEVSPQLKMSLPIKFNRIPHSDHLWDAVLVDARGDNCFQIEGGEWIPRCRIKFAPDDTVEVFDPSKPHQQFPAGIPVEAGTKLKRGQKAFKMWGSSWHLVTIQAVVPNGVSITWDGWNNQQETCQRSELSLLED